MSYTTSWKKKKALAFIKKLITKFNSYQRCIKTCHLNVIQQIAEKNISAEWNNKTLQKPQIQLKIIYIYTHTIKSIQLET